MPIMIGLPWITKNCNIMTTTVMLVLSIAPTHNFHISTSPPNSAETIVSLSINFLTKLG